MTVTTRPTAVSGERRAPRLTSVAKKTIVAVTGLLGVGFVISHMVGNLKVFLGPEEVNHYGEWLRELGEPAFPRTTLLWALRLGLIGAVALHITFTMQLWKQSRDARPVGYVKSARVQASPASKTMRWGGLALIAFILFHLADYTWGFEAAHPGFVRGDIYGNLVGGFGRPWAVAVYLIGVFALSMHLYHGIWSTSQTLGLKSPRSDQAIRAAALLTAVVIFVGFSVVPLGVAFGVIA